MKAFSIKRRLSLLVLACPVFATAAAAQFQGDIYFEPASLVIEEGSSADITVKFFSGTDPVGSLLFDVNFEANEVSFEESALADPSTPGFDSLVSAEVPMGLGFCVFNDDSFSNPFGTSTVFTAKITPLVSAGKTIVLTLEPRDGLKADGTPFANLGGLALPVTVIPPSSAPSSSDGDLTYLLGEYAVPHPFSGLLVPVRREGYVVDTWARNSFRAGDHSMRLRRIQTLSRTFGEDTPGVYAQSVLRNAYQAR